METNKNFQYRTDTIWVEKAKELYRIKQSIKQLESTEQEVAQELRDLTNNQSALGQGFKFEEILRPGAINYSDIPQLKGVNLDLYRKTAVTCWKLTYEPKI